MSKHIHFLMPMLFVASISPAAAMGRDVTVAEDRGLELAGDDVIEIESNSAKGFNFPYYLFVPDKIDRNEKVYLFVETNNTGTATDDFEVHRQKALSLVRSSYANRMARSWFPFFRVRGPAGRLTLMLWTETLWKSRRESLRVSTGNCSR